MKYKRKRLRRRSKKSLFRKIHRITSRAALLSIVGVYAIASFPLGLWPWPAPSPPKHKNNICTIFQEKQGTFTGWYDDAQSASKRHGIPVGTIMAFITHESAFEARARPPWKYKPKLGFIPWWTRGTDYGYGQFIDSTWDWYRGKSGNWLARRDNFSDVTDAIGTYARDVHMRTGTPMNDTFRHYVAYNAGPDALLGKSYPKPVARQARAVAKRAAHFEAQLQKCRAELERGWVKRLVDWFANQASERLTFAGKFWGHNP